METIKPEKMRITFRQVVGLFALAIGILSIPAYMVASGKNYFIGLTPGWELFVIAEYLFLFTSFAHKLVMIIDNKKIPTGMFSVLFWVLIMSSFFFAPRITGNAANLQWTLADTMTCVIFLGWFLVDAIDVSFAFNKR